MVCFGAVLRLISAHTTPAISSSAQSDDSDSDSDEDAGGVTFEEIAAAVADQGAEIEPSVDVVPMAVKRWKSIYDHAKAVGMPNALAKLAANKQILGELAE
jgi:hypothetical protein